jgi:hypothetical protein
MLNTYVNLPANPDTDLLDVIDADVELARFGVLPYTTMAISYADLGTAGFSWIADLQWSDNAVDWFAFATPVQIGPGIPASYFTPIDVSDCAFVRLVVTTGEGSSTLIRVAVCAKGPSTIQTFTNLGMGIDYTIKDVSTTDTSVKTVTPVFPCSKFSKMSCTASNASDVAWNIATLYGQWSNDKVNWYDFPSGVVLSPLTSTYSVSGIDITTFAFFRFIVNKKETGVSLRLAVCMKSTS